jgi:hypothetical protein
MDMTARAIDESITPLLEIESRIQQTRFGALSLDPGRKTASSPTEVVSALADSQQLPHLASAAAAFAEAQLRSFPENLFWDFDFYLASIHRDASAAPDYASYLEEVTRLTVGLMTLYGQQSVIRFGTCTTSCTASTGLAGCAVTPTLVRESSPSASTFCSGRKAAVATF